MAARTILACGLICLIGGQLEAQDLGLTVFVKGNLTTSSQVFPYPHSDDPIQRAHVNPISGAFGSGIELRYHFPDANIAVGLSSDYIQVTTTRALMSEIPAPVDEGYRVVPIEATGYFYIPFSGKTVTVFMGAGGGAYIGSRIYRIAGVEAESIAHTTGLGIHVLTGVSVRVWGPMVIAGEMKFRDLQFESTNQFPSRRIPFGNSIINVTSDPFVSAIHTDGIIFQIGVGIAF